MKSKEHVVTQKTILTALCQAIGQLDGVNVIDDFIKEANTSLINVGSVWIFERMNWHDDQTSCIRVKIHTDSIPS